MVNRAPRVEAIIVRLIRIGSIDWRLSVAHFRLLTRMRGVSTLSLTCPSAVADHPPHPYTTCLRGLDTEEDVGFLKGVCRSNGGDTHERGERAIGGRE